ncbi:hypothetical protein CPB86DRAFT_717580 [Serendipita vermifera]|nr:hypothetical protein CPB86DRAFT_717580 [Serendipita vermifera]
MLPERWCPRTDTVSQLLDLLHQYRLVNVRAPPGSGKTALMHLLHARIMEETPDAQVYIHDSWPEDKLRSRDYRNHLYEKLPGYPNFRDSPRYFLFDKGETTYWDGSLWLTFKDRIQPQIRQHGLVWAILFSNYGDGVPWRENGPVPLVFGGGKVTLYRFPRHDSRPFGLLMDKGEYNDVLARYRPRFRIADDLREFIYDLTNGYIGCIMAVVEYLRHQRRDWMLEREDYSLEYFMEDIINYNEFYQKVSENRSMRHVLPENPAEYAQAIRTLFIRGPFGTYSKGISSDVASKLEEGRKIGFIDVDEDYKYMFPSPLHQLLWEWRLASEVDYDPPFSNLFDFLEATVAYLPLKLVGSDGPTEARYRKAFYHSVQFVTRGNAQSLPDHVASTRIRVYRVDFIIPIKSWGIRLIRDEKEITDHKYWFHRLVRCQKEQVMEENKLDGIVDLGFCDTRPQEKYPALENMYRVWIDGAQSCYEIYDNMLNVRGKGNILQQNDP